MNTILSHTTALTFWLSGAYRTVDLDWPSMPPAMPGGYVNFAELPDSLKELATDGPKIHVLGSASRCWAEGRCHACNIELPSRSIARVRSGALSGLCICGPELSLAQSAGILSLPQLLRAAYKLCGSYDTDRRNRRIGSVTNVRKIGEMIRRLPNMRGIQKARTALRYMLDNSWSERESMLAIHCVLPYRLGGYGLPKPVLNYKVGLNNLEKRTSGKNYLVIDMYWPDREYGIEYDSNKHHTYCRQIDNDSRRSGVLMHKGIEKVSITTGMFDDFVQFDKTARMIGRDLGKRVNPRDEDHLLKVIDLRLQMQAEIPDNIWM